MNTKRMVREQVQRLLAACAWIGAAAACLPAAAQVASAPVVANHSHVTLNTRPLAQHATPAPTGALSAAGRERAAMATGRPADQVELNPQPLPPKIASPTIRRAPVSQTERGIIIVSGQGAKGKAPTSQPLSADKATAQ